MPSYQRTIKEKLKSEITNAVAICIYEPNLNSLSIIFSEKCHGND